MPLTNNPFDLAAAMGLDTSLPPPPYGGRPKFVKLDPTDDGKGLASIFYEGMYYVTTYYVKLVANIGYTQIFREDPRVWRPKPGPLGKVHAWGVYDQASDLTFLLCK